MTHKTEIIITEIEIKLEIMNEGLEFKTKFQVGEFAYFMHDNIVEYRKIDKIYIEIFDSKKN